MIGTIIGLIFLCIIAGVVWWAIQQLLPLIPLAEPFHTFVRILMVVLLVVFVLWFATILLGMAGIHVPTFR
jgi:peptidoglycan biosynthesis protein MviN/MurJ (putative lipid II flippase)